MDDEYNWNCTICGVNMGQNPRQYCKKTYCPLLEKRKFTKQKKQKLEDITPINNEIIIIENDIPPITTPTSSKSTQTDLEQEK